MVLSLQSQGVETQKIACAKENEAWELYIDHSEAPLRKIVADIMADQPYDAIIQPVATRHKKLLISDMDSTMITVECIDELADFVGKKKEVAEITDRAMNGELNFDAALTARVALLADLLAHSERIMNGDAFTAGILHGMGLLALDPTGRMGCERR